MVHCHSETPNSVDPITFGCFQRLECTAYTHQWWKQQLFVSNVPQSASLVRWSGFCSFQLLWHLQINKGKKMGKSGVHIPVPWAGCAVHNQATSHRLRHFLDCECRQGKLRGHNLKLENNIGKIGYGLHMEKSMDSHLQWDFVLSTIFKLLFLMLISVVWIDVWLLETVISSCFIVVITKVLKGNKSGSGCSKQCLSRVSCRPTEDSERS